MVCCGDIKFVSNIWGGMQLHCNFIPVRMENCSKCCLSSKIRVCLPTMHPRRNLSEHHDTFSYCSTELTLLGAFE